jgi:hypothetical protein
MDPFGPNKDRCTMEPINYNKMYLADLKLIAKTRRIKMYYVKTKEELVTLLSMAELPQAMKVEKMTIHQLRDEAKKRGIVGFWELRRPALVELLFPKEDVTQTTPYENQQNESKADEHHQPEKHDAKDVGIKNV